MTPAFDEKQTGMTTFLLKAILPVGWSRLRKVVELSLILKYPELPSVLVISWLLACRIKTIKESICIALSVIFIIFKSSKLNWLFKKPAGNSGRSFSSAQAGAASYGRYIACASLSSFYGAFWITASLQMPSPSNPRGATRNLYIFLLFNPAAV
jgi:hypothetical protein